MAGGRKNNEDKRKLKPQIIGFCRVFLIKFSIVNIVYALLKCFLPGCGSKSLPFMEHVAELNSYWLYSSLKWRGKNHHLCSQPTVSDKYFLIDWMEEWMNEFYSESCRMTQTFVLCIIQTVSAPVDEARRKDSCLLLQESYPWGRHSRRLHKGSHALWSVWAHWVRLLLN